MKISHFIWITVGLFHLTGCSRGNSSNTNTDATIAIPQWNALVSEQQCGIYKPRQVVIKTQEEFDQLWEETQKGIDAPPVKPKVDFQKSWVIAGYLGTVKSASHKLEIKSVEAGADKTTITLRHERPAPSLITAQVIESPYFLASINHFKPDSVEFKLVVEDAKTGQN